MKLFFHYCLFGFSNCYILGSDFSSGEEESPNGEFPKRESPPSPEAAPQDAIIIDPGGMDEEILNFIEQNEYTLRGILVTHDHRNHVHGLRTIKRIYDADIYGVNHVIRNHKTNIVKDGDVLNLGPFRIEVISVPGHSSDSAVYRIEHLLFTGDVLSAGLVGSTASSYGAAVQMTALRSKILSIQGNIVVLPGHGPPSCLETERRFNAGILNYDQNKNQRPVFSAEIW
ncbi:MAG: MBL fold metallo-hydrolase [Treponema sp.]|jgi:glyoxylase-like metal-dependent hydrolase (beta-lactamase superfamily II)|nr:MBL fold metallo-hydrolase [Treponema sp.]